MTQPHEDMGQMALADPALRTVFWDVHSGLPREGPGNRASTERAVALAAPIPLFAQVLDVACGPGAQTMDLATLLPRATVCAIDTHEPFVEETNLRAAALGVNDRVTALRGDMRSLEFSPSSFDLIWCEGAAYIIAVERALRSWRPLLRPNGRLAVSEAIWLRADVPEDVHRCWSDDYPGMGDAQSRRDLVRDCGYHLLGDFVLPDAAWWEYYGPMEKRLRVLASKYAGNLAAESVLRESAKEIANYRAYGMYYGYLFMVMVAKP